MAQYVRLTFHTPASAPVYYDFPALFEVNEELKEIGARIDALRPEGYRSIHSTNYLAVKRRHERLVELGDHDDEEFEEDERELKEYVTEKREWRQLVDKVRSWRLPLSPSLDRLSGH